MSEDQINRRKYPRYNAPICYRSASLFSARKPLVNISLGGIRIYSDDEFKIGKRLEVELMLPDDSVLICTAKVVWQKLLDDEATAKYDTGLQFLDISSEHLGRLSEVLEADA
jgi:c-di-GMP-binding flagellar brake protein YcgR